ncbi:MAG: hypothetical protein M1816_007688 [Peltula sp. TS41687]|nr:MAG: hypothetical protein M1816_007688 [Peltula sp. TS41687]
MPSKIQLDENLWFLYICLQKSDYKVIDFNAVGDVTNLKAPAARMRYTRLRRAIESGALAGTHATAFQAGQERMVDVVPKKRRRSSFPEEVRAEKGSLNEDDFEVLRTRSGSRIGRAIHSKEEYRENLQCDEDTDDELPLMKRRASGLKQRDVKTGERPSVRQGEMPLTQAVDIPSNVGGTPLSRPSPPQPSRLTETMNTGSMGPVQPSTNAAPPSDELSCARNLITATHTSSLTAAAKPSVNSPQVIVLDSDDS